MLGQRRPGLPAQYSINKAAFSFFSKEEVGNPRIEEKSKLKGSQRSV